MCMRAYPEHPDVIICGMQAVRCHYILATDILNPPEPHGRKYIPGILYIRYFPAMYEPMFSQRNSISIHCSQTVHRYTCTIQSIYTIAITEISAQYQSPQQPESVRVGLGRWSEGNQNRHRQKPVLWFLGYTFAIDCIVRKSKARKKIRHTQNMCST